jgi:LytS/YehU family sensor histidine kinase
LDSLLLADLVRDALRDPGDHGSVRQELDRLQPYLALEQARFEDQLALELHVDPEVLDTSLPPLLLQTLVENAIRHGSAEPGCPLAVRIEMDEVRAVSSRPASRKPPFLQWRRPAGRLRHGAFSQIA